MIFFSLPDEVEVYPLQGQTQFRYDLEMNLCGGRSEYDFADEFRRALHLLTKDIALDFKASLHLYYLEHEPDLSVEFDRQALAV